MQALSPHRTALTWTTLSPVVGVILLAALWGRDLNVVTIALAGLALGGTVLAAVHHAEVIAHRVGEPFGSLVLAVAVTVIEVALIVTLMIAGGDGAGEIARDTVFAAVMITCNGIVGLSLLLGARRFSLVNFNAEGTGAALATVTTLAVMTLVLPSYTTSAPGPEFSSAQLAFASLASLLLYGAFVSMQTHRHRDFFLPENGVEVDHAEAPSNRSAVASLGLLLIALIAVVGLAKIESKPIEDGVAALGLPAAFVGVVIALLVLAPESMAAARAARRDLVQTSLNLSYGSAMATIGLTIPAISLATVWLDTPLILGLGDTQIVLLVLTCVVSILTVVPGRATRLQGIVHLAIFAAFVFLAANP